MAISQSTEDCCTSCAGRNKICKDDVRAFNFGGVVVSLCRCCRKALLSELNNLQLQEAQGCSGCTCHC